MSADLVVPYDGTSNDDDALALAKLLAQTQIRGRVDVGASLGGHVRAAATIDVSLGPPLG